MTTQINAVAIFKKYVIPIAVTTLLLAACYLTSYAALFPDETAYKIFLERYFLNGGFKQTVTPYCEDTFLLAPGFSLVPAAATWSWVTRLGIDYFSYRVLSYAGLFLVFFILAWINLRRGKHDFWPLLLLVTFGPVLYGITLFRPEIFILTASLMLCALGHSMLKDNKPWVLAGKLIAALFVFSLCLFIHPRAVYMTLIMIGVMGVGVTRLPGRGGKIIYGALGLVCMAVMLAQSIDLNSKQFMQCRSSIPAVQAYFSDLMQTHAANPVDIIKNPERFFKKMSETVSAPSLQKGLNGLLYRTSYQDNFLPTKDALSVWDVLANSLFMGVIIIMLGYVVYKLFRCGRDIKDPSEKMRFALVCLVILSLWLPICFSIVKQFYEMAFVIFALMVSASLLWSFLPTRRNVYITLFHTVIMAGALLCCYLSYTNFTLGFKAGFVGPGVAYCMDWAALEKAVPAALRKAGIPESEPLFVDDYSYGAARQNHPVISVTHFSLAAGVVSDSIRHYSVDRGIRFGVIRCFFAPIFEGHQVKFTVLERIPVIFKSFERVQDDASTLCVFRLE